MNSRKISATSTGILISLALAYLAFAYPTIFPTGTTIYKPDECYNSYILISDHDHPSDQTRAQSKIPVVNALIFLVFISSPSS